MFYLSCAVLIFLAGVAVHIIFCRTTRASGLHAKAFILISAAGLAVYAAIVLTRPATGIFDPSSFWGLPFKLTAAVIFAALVPVYLSFYVLTQLVSPSQRILQFLSGQEGVSYAQILAVVEGENFVGTRLDDLCLSGCAALKGERYVLTLQGKSIALFLRMMDAALGREGEG